MIFGSIPGILRVLLPNGHDLVIKFLTQFSCGGMQPLVVPQQSLGLGLGLDGRSRTNSGVQLVSGSSSFGAEMATHSLLELVYLVAFVVCHEF